MVVNLAFVAILFILLILLKRLVWNGSNYENKNSFKDSFFTWYTAKDFAENKTHSIYFIMCNVLNIVITLIGILLLINVALFCVSLLS